MKKATRNFIYLFTHLVILISALSPGIAAQQKAGKTNNITIEATDAFLKLKIQTPAGSKLEVYLPNDMAAGDMISGTVVAESANTSELQGSVIEAEKTTSSVLGKIVKFTVPLLPSGGEIGLILKDKAGKVLAKTTVPFASPVSGTGQSVPLAPDFSVPKIAQAGRPLPVNGPFDGDASNTVANFGGIPLEIIAESPRQTIFRSPMGAIGEQPLEILEQNTYFSTPVRNIGINLSAPKLTLRKGEKTDVRIQISGLKNLKNPVEMNLNCTGSANMQGGNQQVVRIEPNAIGPGGVAINTQTLTGISLGGFTLIATVFANPAQQPCPLKDKVIHVEGAPGGGDGLWIVPVTTPDGKRGNIFIKAEKKPDLKFCNWIKIKDCETNNGVTTVSDYEKAENPNKPPPTKPAEPPKPKETPKPPPTTTGSGETVVVEQPCKNGDIRNRKEETKEFEIMTADSKIDLSVTKSTDGAVDAALGLSNFWKSAKKIGDIITDRLPEGSTVAGWVLGYLDRGSEVLDAVAASDLKNTAKEINISLGIGTKKIKATCISFEVCINGKWAPKKMLEKSERDSAYQKSLKISYGDDNWFKIAQDSKPQMFDPAKLDAFIKDWLKKQIDTLKSGEDAYNEFVKNCK